MRLKAEDISRLDRRRHARVAEAERGADVLAAFAVDPVAMREIERGSRWNPAEENRAGLRHDVAPADVGHALALGRLQLADLRAHELQPFMTPVLLALRRH